MEIIKIIALAVVQGLTEFLPVSSSGHLVIFERLLHLKRPGLILEIALHLGTALAVVAVYWRDIGLLCRDSLDALRGKGANPQSRRRRDFALAILVATIPTAFIGLVFRAWVERMFESLPAVGAALMVTGLVLWLTRFANAKENSAGKIGLLRAVLIGIVQGVAIVPGISRSGATISCGLLLGLDRETAARFSFLLSIPAILGAVFLESRNAGRNADWLPLLAGLIVSFLVGYLALRVLLRLVKRGKLHLFSYYCLPLGLLTILGWALLAGR